MLLVVEGYMDVVALAQFGVDYAVASLGTAIRRTNSTPVSFCGTSNCCYDGDRADEKQLGERLMPLPYLEDGRQLKFVFCLMVKT